MAKPLAITTASAMMHLRGIVNIKSAQSQISGAHQHVLIRSQEMLWKRGRLHRLGSDPDVLSVSSTDMQDKTLL